MAPILIIIPILIGVAALIGFNLLIASWYMRFTGLQRGQSALLWFGSLIVAGAVTGYRVMQVQDSMRNLHDARQEAEFVMMMVAGFLLIPAAALLAAKLYNKWIGGQFTPEEKAPGADGIRAWLKGGNLICAALIALFAWLGFGYSLPGILALTVGALLAYPLLTSSKNTPLPEPEMPKQGDASAERERILKMVEDGKITPGDSATLLGALCQPPVTSAQGAAMTPARKIVCLGAALVVVGFFLPWFSINPAEEVKHGIRQATEQLGQVLPGGNFTFDFKTPSIQRNGGEMPNGLGWMVLLLSVGVAGLPFLALKMDRPMQRNIAFGALGLGAFVLIYFLTQDPRHASIGIIFAMAGYAIELAGTMRDRHP